MGKSRMVHLSSGLDFTQQLRSIMLLERLMNGGSSRQKKLPRSSMTQEWKKSQLIEAYTILMTLPVMSFYLSKC